MAKGKYAHIIDKLPKMLGTEPAYQEKVNAVKLEIVKELTTFMPPSGADFARLYAEARAQKDEIEESLSGIDLQLTALAQLIDSQYEVEGVTSIRLESGPSVSVQYEPHTLVEDKEAYRLWCISQGFEKQMVLPWMSTNSIVKGMLLEGEPEPPGTKAHCRTKLVLRKG